MVACPGSVHSIDKILPLFLAHLDDFRYDRENKVTLEHFTRHMQHHRKKAQIHAGAFEYYEAIWAALVERPERFYQPNTAESRPAQQGV